MVYHILDTETASLSGGVCEIAWIVINDNLEEVESFHSLVNPERPIEPGAQAVHGISDAEVADKPTLAEIAKLLPHPIHMIAHNAPFDRRMVQDHIQIEAELCTLQLSRQYVTGTVNHKLATLAEHFGGCSANAHNALGDCRMVLQVLTSVLPLTGQGLPTLFTRQAALRHVHRMPFGKYKGKLTMQVPSDYRRWLLQQPGIDPNIVYTFRKLEGIK